MKGITFNDKHSYMDFGLYIVAKSISPPSKKKIKVDIPFMNSKYDFSTVGSNGEIVYNHREITINFFYEALNRQQLYVKYSSILEWLQDVGQSKLIFDDIPDYYFLAEIEETSTFEEFVNHGYLTVVFVCEPFKYGINEEGDNIWDTFNFETDYLQDTEFYVSGTKTVTIYNPGRLVMPIINADNNMSIEYNSKTYSISKGDNKLYGLRLSKGANKINIKGTGYIKFKFRKQVL